MITEFKLPADREKEQRSRIAQAKKQGKVFLIRRSDLVKPTERPTERPASANVVIRL